MTRGAVVRAGQWWDHKVPPIVALAALALGSAPGSVDGRALLEVVALLCSVVGVAAFGHVLNDVADLEADALVGKSNAMATRTPRQRAGWIAGSLAVGLAPWVALPGGAAPRIVLGLELALLIAYSLPPVRLKGRGWLGAIADAGYAYAVPFLLTLLTFADGAPAALLAAVTAWGLLLGMRGIVWHQLADLDADRRSGIDTVATRLGVPATERVVGSILLPAELVLTVALVARSGVPWLPWLAIAFLAYRAFQLLVLWTPPLDLAALRTPAGRVRILGFEIVNEGLERWLPVAALIALALDAPIWWSAVLVQALAFHSAPRHFLAHDLWVLPDAIERALYSRHVWSDVRSVAAQRRERIAAGPAPLPDGVDRRFVFVVCGPSSHVDTLATALRHLRPVTRAELWVLTDARRNEHPIDLDGVDQLVDVATPDDLDDHQASIWLKTSVHRHLPPGEWCYLDSDIIAIAPGVEGVFDARTGPIAFASDVTIVENSVDRFSPWAMTCDCLGYGEQHSCAHLREQLAARFGLDVPGDWLHWNGGVFVFGPEAAPVLDRWHEWAVASFAWPEWKTRDQGALIATAWSMGLQDLDRLPFDFNFIADLNNGDLCLDARRGWAHHPAGPWYQPKLLHLYTSPLDDPTWDLGADVEAVVVRRSKIRMHRWERGELKAKARHGATNLRWTIQTALETLAMHGSHLATRLTPSRVWRSVRRRVGIDVSDVPIARPRQPEGDTHRSAG